MKRVFETAECKEFHILGAEIRKALEPNERTRFCNAWRKISRDISKHIYLIVIQVTSDTRSVADTVSGFKTLQQSSGSQRP